MRVCLAVVDPARCATGTASAHFVFSTQPETARLASARDDPDLLRQPAAKVRRRQAEMQAVGRAGRSGGAGGRRSGCGRRRRGGVGDGGGGFGAFQDSHAATPADLQPARAPASTCFLLFGRRSRRAASALADCQVPSPIHVLFPCKAPETVNNPCETPVRKPSYTVPLSSAMGTGAALYALAS